jgi:hypothetical protein
MHHSPWCEFQRTNTEGRYELADRCWRISRCDSSVCCLPSHHTYAGTIIEVNVSELGLVTPAGKVVWGKYAQVRQTGFESCVALLRFALLRCCRQVVCASDFASSKPCKH